MARTFASPRHDALGHFLVEKRKKAGLRQVDLAKRLKRRQDYISYVETGQQLVEVIERMKPTKYWVWSFSKRFDPCKPSNAKETGICSTVKIFCRRLASMRLVPFSYF